MPTCKPRSRDFSPGWHAKPTLRWVRRVEEHASGTPTVYLNYVGPLQADITSRFQKVDFSRDEVLVFPPEQRQIMSPYSDCQGREAVLVAYSVEEILVRETSLAPDPHRAARSV